MSDWTDEIEKEFSDKNTQESKVDYMKLSNKNINLLIVVFLLTIGVIIIYKNKLFYTLNKNNNVVVVDKNTNQEEVDKLKLQYETITRQILDKHTVDSEILALIATVNNHNLNVIKKDLPKNELIFINSDWTIDRLPNQIKLTQKDQEFLNKFLKVK